MHLCTYVREEGGDTKGVPYKRYLCCHTLRCVSLVGLVKLCGIPPPEISGPDGSPEEITVLLLTTLVKKLTRGPCRTDKDHEYNSTDNVGTVVHNK